MELAPAGREAADAAEIDDLLQSGRHALEQRGDLSRARGLFLRAAQLADASSRDDDLGRAVLGWSGIWVHESRGVVDAARMAAWRGRAVGRVDRKSLTGLRLAARIAAEDDYVDCTTHRVEEAIGRARRAADPVLLGETLNLAHHCMLGPVHAAARLATADELIAHGATDGRPVDLVMGLLWRTVDLFLVGHPQAQRALEELRRTADKQQFLAASYVVSAMDVMLAMRAGRLEEAERQAGDCYRLGERVGDADALGWYGAHLSALRWYQDRSDEMAALLVDMSSSPTLAATDESFWAALAVSSSAAGMTDQAALALARLRGRGLADLRHSSTWMVSLLGACEASCALDDGTVAAEAYELLAPYADRPVMASLAIACFGSTHYPLGLAALAMGRPDLARTHLDQAVRDDEMLGNLPAAEMAARRLRSVPHPLARGRVQVEVRRVGPGWQVSAANRTVQVDDCVGMRYVAYLATNPGVEVRAADLAGVPAEAASQQPLVDRRAADEYRRRIETLKEAMEDAVATGHDDALVAAQEEYDALLRELARSTGLGGRSRGFAGPEERARTSVQKAIKRALARLRAADPDVAQAVEPRVTTGFTCCFHA